MYLYAIVCYSFAVTRNLPVCTRMYSIIRYMYVGFSQDRFVKLC